MYKLRIFPKAEKAIKRLPHPLQKAIILALTEIEEEPFLGKPLTRELTGKFSFRVGVHRIIYTVNEKNTIINIITVGHRATVYGK